MPKYKFVYFNGRGNGEIIRYIFKLAGVDFEDKRLSEDEWPDYKPKTPFSQLPVLFIDDLQLAQTHAIGRYLSKKFNLFGEDDLDALRIDQVLEALNDMLQSTSDWLFFEEDEKKKIEKKEKYFRNLIEKLKNLEKFLGHANYFLGSKISYADVAFFAGFEFIELIENGNPEVVVTMENTPKLKDLYYRVANEPAIAAWRNERPKTCF